MVTPFCVLGICFVKSSYALSLFNIVKGGGYFIAIVVAFMCMFMVIGIHDCCNLNCWFNACLFFLIASRLVVNCDCLLTCSYPYLFCSTLVTIPFWRCQRGRICWCISSYVTIYIVMFVCSFWCISFTQCFRGD